MKLLYLGPPEFCDHVRACLGSGWSVMLALTDAEADASIADVDAVLDAYMKVGFPPGRLARGARLQLFVTATTGADHVDAATLERMKVPLLTLRGQTEFLKNITPAAEHSWLLLMACARRLRAAVDQVLRGGWDRNLHPGIMLRGRSLGVVGCGRIGQWMSRYAAAFGMRVLGYDPHLHDWPEGIERTELGPLLEQSDFVSVHVPLNAETAGLLGQEAFSRVKLGAILVNTSRGEIVDEAELLKALREGRLAAAGIDVLQGEPKTQGHPLVEYARAHDNLIITPHIGGFSPDALADVLKFSCARIVGYFQGDVHGR